MNEIAAMSDSTTLPGYVLSKWRIVDYADAEQEFRTQHLREAAMSAEGLSPGVRDAQLAAANEFVGEGRLDYGSRGFKLKLLSAGGVRFGVWLCLRQALPEISREKAASLVTPENHELVASSIMALLGFAPSKKKSVMDPSNASTGKPSTQPSASAG